MVEFEPPLVACTVSSADYSFEALRATKECVIAVPAVELAEKVMQVGNSSGRNIDKFEAFDLTPVPAERVKPPLIAKCFANLECRVVDTRLVNKYCLFVPRSAQGVDRSQAEESEDHPPPRLRHVRRGR
jgi:flavin reductase (DIM6/NTAB) family NADH-FMN oxidoreductase RutF